MNFHLREKTYISYFLYAEKLRLSKFFSEKKKINWQETVTEKKNCERYKVEKRQIIERKSEKNEEMVFKMTA